MRMILMICTLLLALILCSCQGTPPEIKETEGGTAVILPANAETEEPPVAQTVSIVFMGETIAAPGYYPGVPEQFTPILDDLYLRAALTQRRSVLHYNREVTQEVRDEFESVHREIRQRGHLPFPGDGGGIAGYALVDLDGDGIPELLILDIPSRNIRNNQIPVIRAIHAIRDGQHVVIDNGSNELRRTLLSADGTFYQNIWHGTGYTDLIAFRLEAGMSEFTIISEARASLSFDDGDVPVQYWVKIEDGVETNITEEEFDILHEVHRNPSDLMPLVLVPLFPDEVYPWPGRQPYQGPPPTPLDFPEFYQSVPAQFWPILNDLYLVSERIRMAETEDLFNFYCFTAAFNSIGFVDWPHGAELGYAVADINGDGIPKLLLGTVDGLNNARPNAIFTLVDGEPVSVASFWARSSGAISADGTIFRIGHGGASYTYLSSYRLDENAYTLTQLTNIFSDFSHAAQRPYFVQVVNGRNHFISESVFEGFFEEYRSPSNPMVLDVVRIS